MTTILSPILKHNKNEPGLVVKLLILALQRQRRENVEFTVSLGCYLHQVMGQLGLHSEAISKQTPKKTKP